MKARQAARHAGRPPGIPGGPIRPFVPRGAAAIGPPQRDVLFTTASAAEDSAICEKTCVRSRRKAQVS